jgi:murein DD-endopeptidase MepM/ murein hydrolase activator NlpD
MRRLVASLLSVILLSGCSLVGAKGAKTRDVSHEIQAGDTLSKLADRYGVPSDEIARYNDIKDPRALRIGQRVVIPAVGPLRRGVPEPIETQEKKSGAAQLRMVSLSGVRGYVGAIGYPVDAARYTSRFGWRWSKFHEGIDLAAPEGTEILAAHDGTVVLVSESWSGYGKIVVIKGDRFMTVYGHNSRNRVRKGERVEKGDTIAEVGQTGDASGPHLHFETRVMDENGKFAVVNPMVFYP